VNSRTVPDTVTIPRVEWLKMLRHVQTCMPMEACGLLGGQSGKVERVIPVENIAQELTRFRMDPHGQIEAMLSLDANGETLIGIYHSHPTGPSSMSRTDVDEAAYPEAVHLVWSPGDDDWICRGFIVLDGGFEEIVIRVED
jgi:proteasome lid subunit RPN8/RPN11